MHDTTRKEKSLLMAQPEGFFCTDTGGLSLASFSTGDYFSFLT